MNILPPPSEKDEQYKNYFSVFKSAAKMIAGDASKTVYADWMRNVVAKFPYFEHTTPRTMAIAAYMSSTSRRFNPVQARSLLNTVFATVRDVNDRNLLVADVARYFMRLQSDAQ